jgi:phage terminase small subunit
MQQATISMGMTPKAPAKLSAAARRLWQRLVASIDVLDEGKLLMLAILVESYDRRQQARAAIARDGACILDRFKQLKPSPWHSVERDSSLAMMRAFHSLGFDAHDALVDRRLCPRPGEIDVIEAKLAG